MNPNQLKSITERAAKAVEQMDLDRSQLRYTDYWLGRYAVDVPLLLAEIERLRQALADEQEQP